MSKSQFTDKELAARNQALAQIPITQQQAINNLLRGAAEASAALLDLDPKAEYGLTEDEFDKVFAACEDLATVIESWSVRHAAFPKRKVRYLDDKGTFVVDAG